MTILGWFENLAESEMPPRWMWHLPDELQSHFEKIKADRKAGTPSEPDVEGPVIQNEHARHRGRHAR